MLEGRSIPRVWSFTRDGRHMAFHDRNSETGFDIWTLPLDLSDPDFALTLSCFWLTGSAL